jgi:nucleoside-diphosphate-sugar epimerase
MRRATIIGASGLIGRAVARRLLAAGYELHLAGRDRAHLPEDLASFRFSTLERNDRESMLALGKRAGPAELLVDCICYTATQARSLLPLAAEAHSTVVLSSKAVYIDAAGRHSNTTEPPVFAGPVDEAQATMEPDFSDNYNSRLGYGACKVAAEQVLLESELPISILRASKVHGQGATRPNEWWFVKRILDKRPRVLLAHEGKSGDHPSAAVNIAALVEEVAEKPGRRVLNAADPDSPTALQISRTIASHLGHEWEEVLLGDESPGDLGRHPWDRYPPVILDTKASLELGYRPVGTYGETVPAALYWLSEIAVLGEEGYVLPAGYDGLEGRFGYGAEDSFVKGVAAKGS